MTPFFLGIDGGGSKTASAVVDQEGRVVKQGLGGPSNGFHCDPQTIVKSIRDAASIVRELDQPVARSAVVLPNFEAVQETLEGLIPGVVEWISEHESALSAAGQSPDEGVVIVAGTGSNAFACRRGGQAASVGGWGSLLGDEGSGYDISLRAIRHALKALDGRAAPTSLTSHMAQYFGLSGDCVFRSAIHIARQSRDRLAGFAARVGQADAQRDSVAAGIINEAAQSLGSDALHAAKRVFRPDEAFPVVLIGGAFAAAPRMTALIENVVKEEFPRARVIIPADPPAVGAARLALARHSSEEAC